MDKSVKQLQKIGSIYNKKLEKIEMRFVHLGHL